jgi:hypothetical protein
MIFFLLRNSFVYRVVHWIDWWIIYRRPATNFQLYSRWERVQYSIKPKAVCWRADNTIKIRVRKKYSFTLVITVFKWYPCTYNSLLYFAWTFYFYTVTKHTILFNSNIWRNVPRLFTCTKFSFRYLISILSVVIASVMMDGLVYGYPCTYNSLLYFAWTFYFYTVTKHTILFNSNWNISIGFGYVLSKKKACLSGVW